MEKKETIKHIEERLHAMKSARVEFDEEWDMCDLQFDANSYEDPVTGRFIYNDDMEQSLIEQEVGRTAGEIIFDVKPSSYETDVNALEASKYVLRSFLDKENAHGEFRTFKQDKGRYGTAIFYTGLRYDAYFMSQVEKQSVDTMVSWFYSKKFKKKVKIETRQFTPQNLPIRSVYLDDNFIRQNNPDKLEDCIIKETVSYETLEQRYKNNKSFSQDWIDTQWQADDAPDYWINPNQVGKLHILHHYYNRRTRMYAIMLNSKILLYEGEMLYNRNALPIRIAQHYTNSACIYGTSIPKKVRSHKAVKINMMQSVIDGARIGSGKMIAMSNGSWFLDQLYVPSGGIGIAELSSSVDTIKEIDTRVDINWPINAIEMINKAVRESTGLDLWAPFETKDETLWQTEIREQNKVTRHKAMDEIYYQCVDRALSDTLWNIAQFAPVLLRSVKSIKSKGKEVTEAIERPKIKIENATLNKVGGITYFEEDFGSFGFLELKPNMLPGDCMVNIVTPYTNSTVAQQLEKEWFNKLIENIGLMAQIYWPEAMINIVPADEVREKAKVAFQYDWQQFVAQSKRGKEKKEVAAKIAKMKEQNAGIADLLTNPQMNDQIPMEAIPQQPAQPPTWLSPA